VIDKLQPLPAEGENVIEKEKGEHGTSKHENVSEEKTNVDTQETSTAQEENNLLTEIVQEMKQLTEAYKKSEKMGKKTQQDMQSMKNEISNLRLAIRGETSEVFTSELEKTQVSPPKDQDAKGAEKEKEATKISSLVQRIKSHRQHRKDYAERHKIPDEDAKLIEDFLHNDIID
ncbi:hypothetical protein Taro_012827, partial [Colocasia esculenta]|nr:hypothetical protein [Colocasia esculenta]